MRDASALQVLSLGRMVLGHWCRDIPNYGCCPATLAGCYVLIGRQLHICPMLVTFCTVGIYQLESWVGQAVCGSPFPFTVHIEK